MRKFRKISEDYFKDIEGASAQNSRKILTT